MQDFAKEGVVSRCSVPLQLQQGLQLLHKYVGDY